MYISKRMMKRYGIPLTVLGFLALLLVVRLGLRSEEETYLLLDKAEDSEVDRIVQSHKDLPKLVVENSVTRNRDLALKGDSNRAANRGILKPKLNANCQINLATEAFSEQDDKYETLQITKSEVYSEKFTFSPSNVGPIFGSNIRLRPDRLMLPVLMRGPNNQLVGLRESIYVAIRLNRTLVIPRFNKHRSDSQLDVGDTVHPMHRVDFVTLCRFVSCITIQQFRKACGNQAGVILRLRHYSKRRISSMETFTGMKFSKNNDPEKKQIKFVPPEPKSHGETIFDDKEKNIKKLFDTQEKCAIYAQPFMNMKIRSKPSKKRIRSEADLPAFTGSELYSEIIRHTPAPSYIRDFSDEFVKTIFGGAKFLTVHWRYDKTDWMKRCDSLEKDSGRKKLCDEALLVEPQDLAQAVLFKIQDLKPTLSGVTHVYFASPPNEKEFIKATKRILNAEKLAVNYLDDILKVLRERYGSCDFLWEHENDIVSTIEMQICTKGSVFLRSTSSSWSSNVITWRRHSPALGTHPDKDEGIFELARKMREKRTQKPEKKT